MRRAMVILVALLLSVAGCAKSHPDAKMAETVQMREQWARAADSGMTAVFGTLANTGHHDARIVSANSPAAGMVELHEVVGDMGSKVMRPKDDGFTIPAGGTRELTPGGDHLMLMGLTAPLQPGADVRFTLVFEDGSSSTVTAQVRDFAGGGENYQPPSSHGHG